MDVMYNIEQAIVWLRNNKHLLTKLPANPEICNKGVDEQTIIIKNLEAYNTYRAVNAKELTNVNEYLNDLCGFTFFVKKDFLTFMEIMGQSSWSVNCIRITDHVQK